MRTAAVVILLAACGPSISTERTTFPDGHLESQYTLQNGQRHGLARTWHSNRALESEGHYVNGKREGTFFYYHDDGTFSYQALFIRDEQVWRSMNRNDVPDRQAIVDEKFSRPPDPTFSTATPIAYFTGLDRTAGQDRVGAQVGVGGPGDSSFGASRHLEAFGLYTPGAFGGYAQVAYTTLDSDIGGVGSPVVIEGGSRYRRDVPDVGVVTARLGVLGNLGDRGSDSFIAAAAGSFHRPADAVASANADVAIRTSASIVHTTPLFVIQADLGVDGVFGQPSSTFDALGRLNLGLGFGAPWALAGVELTNTVVLSDVGRRMHGIGVGGAFRVGKVSVHGLVSRVYNSDTCLNLVVSHEL